MFTNVDTYIAAVQNEKAKYDMAVEQLKDDKDKFMKKSTSRFDSNSIEISNRIVNLNTRIA